VIVTAVGSIPEVVQNEVQGLVVAPGDEDGLAAALARVADKAPELAAMGREARATVIEHYSLRASATRLLELYGELRG
jgi:glycosyltransferase involved in cell wall biosynthesis